MARLILFLLLAVVLAWGAVWVADNPGQVSLEWGGWRVDTSAGILAGAVAALAVVVALLYRLWLFLTRAPGRLGQVMKERRSQKGYKALTKGMVAVAAGDAEEARKQVGKADGLLGEPALTLLLKAQSAQLNGDEKAAEKFFTAMLDDPDMTFLGLRGLMNQALKRGDDAEALKLARRASALNPKSTWLSEARFALESRAGSWSDAEGALKQLTKAGSAEGDQARRMRAITYLGQSVEAEAAGETKSALKFARKAVNEGPDVIPAAQHLVRLLLADGQHRKARGVIEIAWAQDPHPVLAAQYFDASEATDALKKVQAADKLLKLKPDAPAGHLAMAEAALEAKLWGEARWHLEKTMENGLATRTVLTLMARVEEEDRNDVQAARAWLARAAAAPADPAWVCDVCGHVDAHWRPHCPKCLTFDAFHWAQPPHAPDLALASEVDPMGGRAPRLTTGDRANAT